jgi:hypothetical protein
MYVSVYVCTVFLKKERVGAGNGAKDPHVRSSCSMLADRTSFVS